MKKAVSFLAQHAQMSNKEALSCISAGELLVNGTTASKDQRIKETDEVIFKNKTIQEAKKLYYVAFHKPKGVECTLNPDIPNNLLTVFSFKERVFPIGRLDKESEGLLLLTNDGNTYNKLAHSDEHVEKEYEVKVDKPLTEESLEKLRSGIEIMGKMTRPAIVRQLDEKIFNIILTQGLNRQIRRMCYKIGYEVTELKRTRIGKISLQNLKAGEWNLLDPIHTTFC